MKFKTLLSLLLLVTAVVPMHAKHISAQEALERVSAQIVSHRLRPTQQMELRQTVLAPGSQTQIAYIFARPSSQGFMILSADDAQVPVLAYSDDCTIDTSDLPPAMVEWLAGYAAQCSESAPVLAIPKSRDSRAEVQPLISTKWNQKSPYNDQCPIVRGKRAVTGCVATAVAQIMNYHKWPLQGSGTREYDFVVNGVTYSDSFDFGATTFDWDNMLDTYGSSATAEQRDAVATLMHAAGVASLMKYTDEESSATSTAAALGMILNLGYDKSMSYHERDWYGYDDWCSLIYDQLAQGQPVLFGGQSQSGKGHQFICDGYAADNYFHFNWGWGGLSDGYYYMYNLHPQDQGVGSNGDDYDYNQSVVIDIKPLTENSDYVPIIFAGDFYPDNTSAPRGRFNYYAVIGPFYGMTYTNIDVNLGLKLVDSTGRVEYVATDVVYSYSMPVNNMYSYYPYFQVKSMDIPEGDWVATPAFKTASGEWMPMYCDLTQCTGKVYLKVTSDYVYANRNTGSLNADFVGMSISHSGDELSADAPISAGETYDVVYDISSTGAWHGDVRCVIANSEDDRLDWGAPESIDFTEATKLTATFSLPISAARTSGTYPLVLYTKQDGKIVELARNSVTIDGAPGEVTAVKYLPGDDQNYYVNHTYTFDFDITVDAKCSSTLNCMLVQGGYIKARSAFQEVLISEAGTEKVSFKVTLDPTIYVGGLPAGNYELRVAEGNSSKWGVSSIIYISGDNVPVEATAVYNTWTPANGMDLGIFPGREYNFIYDVTTDGIWDGNIYGVMTNGVNTATSNITLLSTKEGTTMPVIITVGIGEDFDLGEYDLTLYAAQNGETSVIDKRTVNVEQLYANLMAVYIGVTEVVDDDPESLEEPVEEPGSEDSPEEPQPDADDQSQIETLSDADAEEGTEEETEDQQPLYIGHTYAFGYDVTADNGPWTAKVTCAIYLDEETLLLVSEDIELQYSTAETISVQMPLTISETLEPGTYNIGLFDTTTDEFKLLCTDSIEIAQLDGISSATVDAVEAKYYNLQGMPVKHPEAGTILIKVQGDKVTKILVK